MDSHADETGKQAQPAGRPDRMEYWSVRDNVYRNDYFGLTYAFPSGMQPASTEEFPERAKEGAKMLEQQRPGPPEGAEEVLARIVPLLDVRGEKLENNLKRRIVLLALDISRVENASAEELLSGMMTDEGRNPAYRVLRNAETRSYGGRTFGEIRYSKEWAISGTRVRFFNGRLVTIAGRYALIWNFTAGSEESLNEIMASADSIHFETR